MKASVNTNVHPVDAIQIAVGKPSDKFSTLKIESRGPGHANRTTYFFYDIPHARLQRAAAAFNRALQET